MISLGNFSLMVSFIIHIIIMFFRQIKSEKIISMRLNLLGDLIKPIIEGENELWSLPCNTYLNFSVFYQLKTIQPSNLGEKVRINIQNNLECNSYFSDVIYENISIPHLNMFICEGLVPSYNRGLGLGYKFTNESFSFIHQLYYKNYIDNLRYTFELQEKLLKYIHFGGIPNNRFTQTLYQGYCNVEEKYFSWGCMLSGITVNGVSYPFTAYSIFQPSFGHTIFSDEIFYFITKVLLKDLFDQDQCKLHNGDQLVYCNKDLIQKKEDIIQFEFDKMTFSIPLKLLFDPEYSFFERNNNKYYNKKGIIFGTSFLNYFNYIDFNYQTKKISLFSDILPITMVNQMKGSYFTKCIFVLNSLICFINIIIIFLNKINKVI